jgi:hypothetical protein
MTSTISEFVLPRPALAGCIVGMLVRDTRGCALDQAQVQFLSSVGASHRGLEVRW